MNNKRVVFELLDFNVLLSEAVDLASFLNKISADIDNHCAIKPKPGPFVRALNEDISKLARRLDLLSRRLSKYARLEAQRSDAI